MWLLTPSASPEKRPTAPEDHQGSWRNHVQGLRSRRGGNDTTGCLTSSDCRRRQHLCKRSVDVLKRFAKLKPVRLKSAGDTLEQLLAIRIAELPMEIPPEDYVRQQVRSGRPFGSRRLAETALQLFDPIGSRRDDLPCFAVVRWLSFTGHSNVSLFGPDDNGRVRRLGDDDEQEAKTGISDLIERYAAHRFFQVRVVRRTALIDVAAALKGLKQPYGNAYGNTR